LRGKNNNKRTFNFEKVERGKGGWWITITSNKIAQNFEFKNNKRTQRFSFKNSKRVERGERREKGESPSLEVNIIYNYRFRNNNKTLNFEL
jgi:hypothetical protein